VTGAPARLGHFHFASASSCVPLQFFFDTVKMERDSLVYKAKLAEQAERFDEMVADMKNVASQPVEVGRGL
jgi:hypothetical protein